MTARASQVAFLREAIAAQPPAHLAPRLYVILADMLPPEELDKLANNLGRAAHMKEREQK